MDSDASSLEDEVGQDQDVPPPSRSNLNDASDVSDEDNISHAARSIESPPESPQIGHFESPPPSPDYLNRPVSPDAPASPDSINKPRSLSPEDSGSESPASYQSPRQSPHDERNISPPIRSPQSPRSPSHQSESPNHSQSSIRSPVTRHDDSPIHSPNSSHSLYHRSESIRHSPTMDRSGRERFDSSIHSPTSIRSPSHGKSPPQSPNSIRSPSQKSETSIRSSNSIRSPRNGSESPQRSQNSVQSPYHRSESPNNRSSYFNRSSHQGSLSPSHSLKRERERAMRSSKLVNENKSRPPRSYRSIRSPPSPRSPPPETHGPRSPDGHDSNSDDGRSNISSASSFSSSNRRTPSSLPQPRSPPPTRVKTLAELKSHAEDLSDVSDLDSLGSVSDEEEQKDPSKKMENGEMTKINVPEIKKDLRSSVTSGLEGEETEQLDFEAEEREEGECEGVKPNTSVGLSGSGGGGGGGAGAGAGGSEDEGELKGDELEEGELTDEGENRPEETEPRPICRFYNRGQCTWGSNCRFVHPGVTDKGNYTMFEMVRPLVPVNGPSQIYPPVDYRPVERPVMGPPPVVVARKEEVPVVESAWERGLRQAKEMLRKSTKRKETEVDFEEKKMNLTLGQDELDKENDYYTRTASPILNDETQRWSGKVEGEPKRYRTVSERFEDYGGGPENVYFTGRGGEWQPRGHHYEEVVRPTHRVMRTDTRNKYPPNTIHGYHSRAIPHQEYYERKRQKSYASREVIVQRTEKTSWKDDSPPASKARHAEGRSGARGDEWADPWMRSKSPLGRKAATARSRKQSYSSGSSYSSSSSRSRSSSSSGSSYSRDSRSHSRSSRSRSRSKKPVSPARRLLRGTSPIKGKAVSPALMEKKAATERALHMNPPPPSPVTLKTNPDRSRGGVPPRLLAHSKAAVAAAMRSTRSHSKSSRSSTGSDSSGSSSDSSESSFSSSSSSRAQSPPVRQKRIVIDEKLALAQAMKVKAMDALKLSGQKQQIKLTLKGTGGVASGVGSIIAIPTGERVPSAIIAGKKRPAESPPESSPPKVGGKTTPKKTAPSRREELLKQLKAVEDAIARKRSKIV